MTSTHSDDDEVEVVSIHSGSTQSNYEPSMTSESPLNQKAEPGGHKFSQESQKQRTFVPTRSHSKAFQAAIKAADAFRSENPFYRVIMQASYIKAYVRVPNDFANSYLRNITQSEITLGISDGRTWEVGYVFRTPTESRLSRGWCRFVADNHLKEGDVCVFELVDREKIQMTVHIFRQQKRFARNTPEIKNYAAGFQATLEAAKEFTSENPFFKVVMHNAYINRGTVTVPAVFATSHLTNIKQMVITLRVSDGRTWEVLYVSQTPTNGRICQGWGEFVADNNLKEGDVCVFELIDRRKNFEMDVYIFRLKYSID
ncbi:putative B3 domain-containing protein Os03g0621600 [Papaver somniferum]|nr:putative B3 domain-containing protein Os03g0621600 [Papaver somniferum]